MMKIGDARLSCAFSLQVFSIACLISMRISFKLRKKGIIELSILLLVHCVN